MSRITEGREQRGRTETEERHEVPSTREGNTVTAQGETQSPKARLPHERDESSDSQAADNPSARRMGELAHDALEQGQQDTSKADELDATYRRVRQESKPAPVDKPNGKQRAG